MEYRIVRTGSDELMHHKYIKRVKGKNGKWRYYYDTVSLKNNIKDKLGVDERESREIAYEKMLSTSNHPEATVEEKNWRFNNFMKANDAYLKTPLGKLENAYEYAASGIRYVKWLFKGKR